MTCMTAFRFDQPMYITISGSSLDGCILTIETNGGEDSNSIVPTVAATLGSAFLV